MLRAGWLGNAPLEGAAIGFAVIEHGVYDARHPGDDCGFSLPAQMGNVSVLRNVRLKLVAEAVDPLESGRLELNTSPVENQIRIVALNRENALFVADEVGAEKFALLASLIANCKMCDVDPVSYFSDTRRALLGECPRSRNDALMPRNFSLQTLQQEPG